MSFAQFSATRKSYERYINEVGGEGNAVAFGQFCDLVKIAKEDLREVLSLEVENAYKRINFHGMNWWDADYNKIDESIRVWVALIDAIDHKAPSFIRHATKVAKDAGKVHQHACLINRVAAFIGA